MPDTSSDPRQGLDEVQPIDTAALMAEIRAEVERRRAGGEYPGSLDDLPPFGDLGLEDDLVASVHRLEALSYIPGVTPVVEEIAAGPASAPAGFAHTSKKQALFDRALVAARAAARRVVGDRLERVVRQGAEYLLASAQHQRVVARRVLELEQRVRDLEKQPAQE